jgi:formate-dependent nitrite reductase membrane component NrfD
MVNGRKLEILVFLGRMMLTMVLMEIFKDNNEWNEKSIIGFIAFAIMCVIMIVDLVTGWLGRDLMINEFVYDSFVFVVLGCFGISGIEKFAKK